MLCAGFHPSEDLGAPISRAEITREQAFESANYWKKLAGATALFAALLRRGDALHFSLPIVIEKYGEEIADKAEKSIREAI